MILPPDWLPHARLGYGAVTVSCTEHFQIFAMHPQSKEHDDFISSTCDAVTFFVLRFTDVLQRFGNLWYCGGSQIASR